MTGTGLGKSNDDKKWSGLKAIQEIQQKGVSIWICRGQERKREGTTVNTQVPGKSPEI